jgi:DNA-binding MarR family transcriptional regulator
MKPEESIGRWVSLIHRQGQIYLGNELREFDIGSAQLPFLMVLYNQDGLSQKEMSKILHVDKATTGRDIKKLVESGYVIRKRDPMDRRTYKIFLTSKGRKIKPRIKKVLTKWTSVLSSDFTDKEYELILELMKRMYQNALESKQSKVTSKRGIAK